MANNQDNDYTFHPVRVPSVFRRVGFFRARPPSYRLGPGGLQVTSDRSFSAGTKLEIELFLSTTESVTCLTRVAWSAPVSHDAGGGFQLGLQILQIEGFDESRVWSATEGGLLRGLHRKSSHREYGVPVSTWGAATAMLFPDS